MLCRIGLFRAKGSSPTVTKYQMLHAALLFHVHDSYRFSVCCCCLSCIYYPAIFDPKGHGNGLLLPSRTTATIFPLLDHIPSPTTKSHTGDPRPPSSHVRQTKEKETTHKTKEKNILFVPPGLPHPGVCHLLFFNRYMRPEGPRQRLAVAIERQLFTNNRFLAQVRITDHNRAPPSPSPPTAEQRNMLGGLAPLPPHR